MQPKILKRLPLDSLMDLKIDYAFKQLFGSQKNKDITVVFLNAILQKTGRKRIKDISFSNTESGGEHKDDKQSRLDLLVVTESNESIHVEIQFTNKYNMIKRSIYYWAGVYREQMRKGMGYKELRPVITINILNFDLFSETDHFHTMYHLSEDEEKFRLTDVMEFHFIEMSKLIKDWKAEKLNSINDVLARWLLMLGMVDRRNGKVYDDIYKELGAIAMKDETLYSALQSWEKLSATPEEFQAYESRVKRILDEEAARREAELEVQEAEQRGEKRGEKKGEKIGAQKANEAMARRLLAKGMEVKDIVEVTGLDEYKVLEIQCKMN